MNSMGALDHDFQLFEPNRFGVIIKGAQSHCAQSILLIGVAGDDDRAGRRLLGKYLFEQAHAAEVRRVMRIQRQV